MSWKKEHASLYSRLLKYAKSTSALDKQIQRLSNKLGITAKQSLFVLAKQKRVGYQADFKRLSKEEQNAISQSINNEKASVTHVTQRLNNNSKIRKSWHEKWWGIILTNAVAGIITGIVLVLILKNN